MKFWNATSFILAGSLAFSTMAFGQYRDRGYYQRGEPRYAESNYDQGDFAMSVLNNTIADLSRVSSYGDHDVRHKAEKARHDLSQFQRDWVSGGFNRHELDEAIGRVQDVMNRPLDPRDREQLGEDLSRLRDLRASWRR